MIYQDRINICCQYIHLQLSLLSENTEKNMFVSIFQDFFVLNFTEYKGIHNIFGFWNKDIGDIGILNM